MALKKLTLIFCCIFACSLFSTTIMAKELSPEQRQKFNKLLIEWDWQSNSPKESIYYHSFRQDENIMYLVLTKKGKSSYRERPLEAISEGYQLRYSKGVIRYTLSGDSIKRKVRNKKAYLMKQIAK